MSKATDIGRTVAFIGNDRDGDVRWFVGQITDQAKNSGETEVQVEGYAPTWLPTSVLAFTAADIDSVRLAGVIGAGRHTAQSGILAAAQLAN